MRNYGSPGQHAASKLPRLRRVGFIGIGLGLTVSATACASHVAAAPLRPKQLGCYSGDVRLTVVPGSVHPGQVARLAAIGTWHSRFVASDSWGLLDSEINGHLMPIYNLAAIALGIPRRQNVRVGPAVAIASVGLPNRPFRIEVPNVPDGIYTIEFTYSAAPTSSGTGPKVYDLCARLTVSH